MWVAEAGWVAESRRVTGVWASVKSAAWVDVKATVRDEIHVEVTENGAAANVLLAGHRDVLGWPTWRTVELCETCGAAR